MNAALEQWGVSLMLDMMPVTPEDLVKNQIEHSFRDHTISGDLPIDRFGHGFQRAVIYELIRLAPRFREKKAPPKKEFNPAFTLILFEEPEAFLHPQQQENMAASLRCIGAELGQQVVITTHSPVFVSKSASDLKQIARLTREEGITTVHQPSEVDLDGILTGGQKLHDALTAFVNDPGIPEAKKGQARKLIAAPPADEIAAQEDGFRFQLWLDGERAAAFFAKKVVICEGASEKALFKYLLDNQWADLKTEGVFILDALGKYNFVRYLLLFNAFGIRHSVLMDSDSDSNEHAAINALVHSLCGKHTLCTHQFEYDLEEFLGTTKPSKARGDRKPIEILKAVTNGGVSAATLTELKSIFVKLCSVPKASAADDVAVPANATTLQ